jgi:ABC-type lipoprotein export system ATPase subunit
MYRTGSITNENQLARPSIKNSASQAPGNSDGDPLIRVCDLVKVYKSSAGDFPALKRINLEVYPGEFLGILGKSGAGKTTLVNMVTGVDHITSGEVWVDKTPVHQLNENQLAL